MKKLILLIIFLSIAFKINPQNILNLTGKSDPCWYTSGYYMSPLFCPEDYDYTLVFEDNFDGNTLDLSKWQIQQWKQGALQGDPSLEYNSLDNVTVTNGICDIIAKKETVIRRAIFWKPDNEILEDGFPNLRTYHYTSSNLWTINTFRYGKFEIRCKIPKIPNGKGFWPAFWLYGKCSQEIDVFDGFRPGGQCQSHETKCINMGYHINPYCNDVKCKSEKKFYDPNTDYSDDFHIYSLEWDEYHIMWSVDGIVRRDVSAYYNVLGEGVNCSNIISSPGVYFKKYLPNLPLHIIINLAISSGDNAPNASTPFPSALEIDYIKVWQRDKGCCASYKLYESTDNLPYATHVSDYIIAGNDAGISDVEGNVTVKNGQNVTFAAGDYIKLLPGFTVEAGANFVAKIEDCTPLTNPEGDDIVITNFPDEFSPDGDGVDDKLCVSVNGATSYNIRVEDKDPPYNTFYYAENMPVFSNPVCVWDGTCNYTGNCWFYHKCNRKRIVTIDFYNCDKTISQSKKVEVKCSSKKSNIIDTNQTNNIASKNCEPDFFPIDIFESHPNPFNNSTQIIFSIQETTNVRLYITSIYGIEVLELVNNELSKGIHNINIKGSALSSGIYYCILETKDSRRHIKLVKM